MDKTELLQILNEVLPEMLKPTVDTLLADVKTFMSESVSPLADKVEAIAKTPKEATKEQPSSNQDDPLVARVKLLEQQLETAAQEKQAQEAQAQDMRFNSTLSSELDKLSPVHKNVVQELLSTRLRKDSIEKDGTWLAKDGKNLSETVQDFFKSPEGLHFLPSSHVNGAGATESAAPKAGDKVDLESAIAAAFL